MKKLITLFSVVLLFTNFALAETVTIKPEKLSRKITKNYKKINALTEKLYTNIETQIDTIKYPPEYKNFPLMKETETQSKKYYYVKQDDAELVFDKNNKNLKFISFKKSDNPCSWIVYNYPGGDLRAVEIYLTKAEICTFTKNGKFINYVPYMKKLQQKIKSYWKIKEKSIYRNSEVQIAFNIDKNGDLKKYKIFKSSKIQQLDDKCLEAVLKAAPFDKFPDNSLEESLDIVFTFKVH